MTQTQLFLTARTYTGTSGCIHLRHPGARITWAVNYGKSVIIDKFMINVGTSPADSKRLMNTSL